jgi:polyisoprenoid-binding protein YceI
MQRRAPVFLCLVLLALTGHSRAADYAVIADKSSLGFVFKQMGVPVDGRFRNFTARIRFDPATPAAAQAEIDLDLASIDAGSAEANDEVAGKGWFNTKAFPRARFVATGVKSLGGNRYEASGQLTIKGRTRDVVAPFTFAAQGNQGVFDGSFALKRADFAIGEGAWADFDTVANEVRIQFHLQTQAVK